MKFNRHVHAKRRASKQQRFSQQKGITLIIGLILLMMLTVVATIGYRNTTLSERMSSGVRDRNLAFQAAESVGQEAVSAVLSATTTLSGVGYYATPLADGANSSFWTQGAGPTVANTADCATQSSYSWVSCSFAGSKYTGNNSSSTYVIELLATAITSSTPVATATTPTQTKFETYRITTRSTGGSGNSDVVIQTVFTKESNIP